MNELSAAEQERYSRHLLIDGFTEQQQLKIKNARVLVIGAGGLGSPVLMYLSGAGVGTIGLVENDTVALSNIHRQVLYTEADIDKNKAECAKQQLENHNSESTVQLYNKWWSESNARAIAAEYDVIVDCSDNLDSRYLSDGISKELGIPFVYGAIFEMEGQASVFNYQGGKSYDEVFPKSESQKENGSLGVIGPIAGLIGSIQAAETLKIITGLGEVLTNKLAVISLKYNNYRVMEL